MKPIYVAIAKNDEEDWNKGSFFLIHEKDFYSSSKDIYVNGEYHDRNFFYICRYKLDEQAPTETK